MLSQERKLREVEEGSKKIGGDLQVQAQRVEDWDPTSHQGTFSIAGSDGLGTPAGESSTPKTPKGSSETSACEASSQEGAGGTARRSPGDWQLSPQPQGSEPRRGASSERGGLREVVGGVQEGSQTPGSGVESDPGLTTTLPRLRGRSGGVLVLEGRAAGRPTQENPPQPGVNLGLGGSGEELDRSARGLSPPPWFGPRSI